MNELSNKEIIEKIKAKAYENVNKKLEEERKRTEDKINNELADVEKCLSYIKNKLVYKIIKKNYLPIKYVLADEDMLFEDYNKEDKYYRGIHFPDDEKYLFRVNGEEYYDTRHMLSRYKTDFVEYQDRLSMLNEDFDRLKKGYEKLKQEEQNVKDIIEQLKKVQIEEEAE